MYTDQKKSPASLQDCLLLKEAEIAYRKGAIKQNIFSLVPSVLRVHCGNDFSPRLDNKMRWEERKESVCLCEISCSEQIRFISDEMHLFIKSPGVWKDYWAFLSEAVFLNSPQSMGLCPFVLTKYKPVNVEILTLNLVGTPSIGGNSTENLNSNFFATQWILFLLVVSYFRNSFFFVLWNCLELSFWA